MAPDPESVYFPLEKCLNGDHSILPWKTVYYAITDDECDNSDCESPLRSFLASDEVKGLLSRPLDAFLSPSAQTKSTFEQKTSAINVTPSANSRYDLKQIKEDALWLSEAVSVDQVSALRIAVIECQDRASAQLLSPFTEDELAGVREATGNSKYSSTLPLSILSQAADPEEIKKEFDSENARRKRLLDSYLAERNSFLGTFNTIIQAARLFQARENEISSETLGEPTWLESLGLDLVKGLGKPSALVSRSVEVIQKTIEDFEKGCGGFADDANKDEIDLPWGRGLLTQIVHTAEITFDLVVSNPEATSSKNLLEWTRLVTNHKYFSALETADLTIQALHAALQSLVAMISLAILKLAHTIDFLSVSSSPLQLVEKLPGDEQYFLNKATIYQIQALLQNTAEEMDPVTIAGPAMLGWTAFLSFLRARVADFQESIPESGNQQPVEYGDVLEQILNKDAEDSIDVLGLKAVNECKVFEVITALAQRLGSTVYSHHASLTNVRMRLVLLDLIQQTTVIGYVPEVVEALISILSAGESYWDHVDTDRIPTSLNPVLAFFNQPDLFNTFLQNAASRYPFESAPFLQLVRALASLPSTYRDASDHALLGFLNEVPVFTYQLPENFREFETVQEEENTNSIQLRQPVELFNSRTKTLYHRSSDHALITVDSDFTIQAGTQGRIVSDSGPRIAFWFHKYSALKYFGKLLETYLTASNVVDATTGEAVDRESASEIIQIMAALVFGLSQETSHSRGATEDVTRVLETASAGLNRNRDIITVIFDIFEEELQRVSNSAGPDISLDVLTSCIHFMHALLPVYPRRVWPLLSQSKLIDTGRGGGRLGTIVEAVELVSGNYDFLISCALLYQAAIDELVENVVRRRGNRKSSARYTEVNDFETGVSDQILSRTLLLFTKYFVDALESSSTWKFANQNNRKQLLTIISTSFRTILHHTFGLVHDTDEGLQPLLGSLSPAASVIVDSFLSTSSGTLRFQSFLKAYYDGFDSPPNTTFRPATRLWTYYVQSVLTLTSTLLRVSKSLNRGTTQFESQIFRSSPLIARLISVHQTFHTPTLRLFESLVLAATNHDSEPPSLLAHLGSFTSRNFIQVLCHIDKPLDRVVVESQTWNFLSVVISNRQQWFSNYLLTGKTPKAALQKGSETNEQHLEKPFLTIVLEKLSLVKDLPQSEALATLKFVVHAQNFWPWTVYSSDKYDKYFKAMLEFVGELKPIQQNRDPLDAIYQTRIAAYIGEIITMYIFHSRQTGSTIDFKPVEENLEYFGRFATEVPAYNPSLHSNLKKNFSRRYNGVMIQALQRTDLEDRELGRDYYYDQEISEKLLSYDAGWSGKQNDGMRNEVALANLNLSLVDAQIALFQSWKVLSIELSNRLSTSEKLSGLLTNATNKCLISNSRPQPSVEIFASLSQTRAELALVLTQRLVQAKSKDPALKKLVNYTWDNIKSLRGSFERVLIGSEITYYRTLLKLLYLALRVHAPQETKQEDLRASVIDPASSSLIPTLLDILKYVVASGIRELASSLHSASSANDSTSTPEDLSILTGILQTILHIPQIELHSTTLVNIFSSGSTARIATTLYSWADTLAVNGDPIYGELSLLFLLELSSIQPMAEQMAIEGVLGQIAAANITNYLRSGNVGPFIDSAGAQRCYGVWVRGILPFCLNLLDAVQIPIASEISLFLSQFPHLLSQSSLALDSPETNRLLSKGQSKFITLTSCAEIHSLALISHILNLYKKEIGGEGIVELEWDANGVSENADWWLSSRDVLTQRIVPMGEREVELSRRSGKGQASVLEEKVVAELEGARSVLSSRD